MPNILLESDFLTVDLNAIAKNKKINTGAESIPNTAVKDFTQAITNWEEELKKRLAANNALGTDAREPELKVEYRFFEDYFKANWKDADCAKQLILMGEPLKKAIKVLGFDAKVNPILAFVSDDFVVQKLIKTKLLNATTFRAIYSAVAKKLIAQSQLLKANSYNIVYCPALYTKSVNEIIDYLKLQNKILPANSNKYTAADLDKNKRVFAAFIEPAEKDFSVQLEKIQQLDVSKKTIQNFSLNPIKLAIELFNKLSSGGGETYSDTEEAEYQDDALSAKERTQILKNLDSTEKKLAAIQFISMVTSSAAAKKALTNDKFNSITSDKLIKATVELSSKLPKALLTKNTDSVVKLILNNL